MRRGLVLLCLVTALVLAMVCMAVVPIISRGVSARDEPTAMEAFMARRLRHLAIPAGERARTNPLPASPENLRNGLEHFADHCAVCHANDGSGKTEMGRGLYPKAPDMRLAGTQDLSDGELFWIIRNGIRLSGMPGWSDLPAAEDTQTWPLVLFIRHLSGITSEEVAEMEAMNPKTPEEYKQQEEIERFLSGGESSEPAPHSN